MNSMLSEAPAFDEEDHLLRHFGIEQQAGVRGFDFSVIRTLAKYAPTAAPSRRGFHGQD